MKKAMLAVVGTTLLGLSFASGADDMQKDHMTKEQMMKECMSRMAAKKDGSTNEQIQTACAAEIKKGMGMGMGQDNMNMPKP
jgi:hypothetical protein